MTAILVATGSGIRVFTAGGEGEAELAGWPVVAMAPEAGGGCVAVVGGHEIWRRSAGGDWSWAATTAMPLGSILSLDGVIFGGASADGAMVRVRADGIGERLTGFDTVPGRSAWFGNGPPLHVRSLAATADGAAILAAVHVGGLPRSADRGETWSPTISIHYDVHEVCAHPALASLLVAAAAVGLCVSHDYGRSWKVLSAGLELTNSLAVAMLPDEALFSIQDGPFARRSQLWRWPVGGETLEPVRDGLPEWLEGKVDTAHIAAGGGRAAVVDGGGNLWVSTAGSRGWERVAGDLPYVFGLMML